jgi:hypothetical protein
MIDDKNLDLLFSLMGEAEMENSTSPTTLSTSPSDSLIGRIGCGNPTFQCESLERSSPRKIACRNPSTSLTGSLGTAGCSEA